MVSMKHFFVAAVTLAALMGRATAADFVSETVCQRDCQSV
jgi:opacity protein-like surface antigen